MADKTYVINKLGLEDLLFGTGTKVQARNGTELVVTEINAGNLPFDGVMTLKQVLDLRYPSINAITEDSPSGKVVKAEILDVHEKLGSIEKVASNLLNTESSINIVAEDLILGVNSAINKVNLLKPTLDTIVIPENLLAIHNANQKAVEAAGSAQASAISAQQANTIVQSVMPQVENNTEDIGSILASLVTLNTAVAQGQFGSTDIVILNSTEKVLPFTAITQSTDTSKFEIGTNSGIIKEAGTYSFISIVEFEDAGADGAVAEVIFNLRDTTTNTIYYTQTASIEISNNDRESIPFNSLMTIPDTMVFPITIDINVVSNISGYRIVRFNSILSLAGGSVQTVEVIDSSLGNLVTGELI